MLLFFMKSLLFTWTWGRYKDEGILKVYRKSQQVSEIKKEGCVRHQATQFLTWINALLRGESWIKDALWRADNIFEYFRGGGNFCQGPLEHWKHHWQAIQILWIKNSACYRWAEFQVPFTVTLGGPARMISQALAQPFSTLLQVKDFVIWRRGIPNQGRKARTGMCNLA